MREHAPAEGHAEGTDADEGLRESEARLRSVLESAPNMIMTADRAGTILFINRVTTPDTLETVIGTSIYDYVPRQDLKRVRDRIEHVLRTGEVTAYEICSPASYGSRTYSVHAGPVRSHDLIVGVTLVTWDVTERVELQARLMASDRLASVGSLAAGVAHEMNNPLTYAMLNLQKVSGTLAARKDDAELRALQESVTFAIEALQRMRDIVRDLMDVARDEGERVGVSLHSVLESSLRIAQHHIEPRARVIRSYGETPPVRAVVSRLGQVFVNLLVNAAQSMPLGRPEANELRVSTYVDDLGSAVVEIADTGSGIPPDLLQRVFDPFVTTKSDGTGLGLFLCNRLVSSMGGELSVVKTGAEGTAMRVRLAAANPA